jgi:immune inhibitor A
MYKNLFIFLPKPMFALVVLVLVAACSTPSETETPQSPTQEIQATAVATALPAEPTPLPTREPVPEGLIQLPVFASAEQTAQELFSAEAPPRDRFRLAQELLGMSPEELAPDLPLNPEYEVDDRLEFMIDKTLNGDYNSLPARLRHISDSAYWWVSVTANAEDEEIIAAAENFENEIVAINRLIFGEEWSPGIDNDPRIHILLVREQNWGSKYGAFAENNEYPTSVEPNSNQKEMFYINLGAVRIDSVAFAGELGHEYHHLIHWNKDPNEEVWWNEAMSELAIFLAGAQPTKVQGRNNAVVFAEHPDIQLTSRPEVRYGEEDMTGFAHYGAERLFAIYLIEQFGPQLIKDIVANPAPGVKGVHQELVKLPGEPSFDDVYASWIVANLINQPNYEAGQFGYQEVKPEPPLLEPVQTFNGEPIVDKLPPYGARYYEVRRDSPVQVAFNGSTMARLTPADPPSGEFVWYSHRTDNSEFTLTRSFDLSDLDAATLNYKTWYQLDNFYDYAYLEISTDGGNTWEILETAHGTSDNPNEKALGIGYTGSVIEWLPESIDLSPYAGQEIQIRYHVITDFTIHRDGFQVDDISIPELGYYDSAEDDTGGWQAQGFVRSSNFVPTEWVIWLVKASNPLSVERITMDELQAAEFEIDGLGDSFSLAAVVVSPTAPVTTMDLDYEILFNQP